MAETVYIKSPRQSGKTITERTRLYRAVHAACRSNGMDNDDRKALQSDLFGKSSLSDMTMAEIARLLDQLNRTSKAPAGHRAHLGKVRALWWSLYWLGEVHQTDDRTIGIFIKRQTGVSAMRWLDHRSAPSVIEALKSWLTRVGVQWPSTADTALAQQRNPAFTANHHERIAVIHAQRALINMDGFSAGWRTSAYIASLGRMGTIGLFDLEIAELDGLIRHLGETVRKGQG